MLADKDRVLADKVRVLPDGVRGLTDRVRVLPTVFGCCRQCSVIGRPVSGIDRPASGIGRPTSGSGCRAPASGCPSRPPYVLEVYVSITVSRMPASAPPYGIGPKQARERVNEASQVTWNAFERQVPSAARREESGTETIKVLA